jgi:hypothetical protein
MYPDLMTLVVVMRAMDRVEAEQQIRRWTFAEVPARFGPIQELAEKHGLLASLFGSTVQEGIGRDLDVLMTVRREMTPDYDGFLSEFGGREVYRKVKESKGIRCVKVAKAGRYYDFVFGTVSGKPRRV